MENQKVNLYLLQKQDFFPPDKIMFVKKKLLEMDEDKFLIISNLDLQNPNHFLLFSIFLGTYGVDRFLLGDIGIGVLKLLTGGLCGILWIIDIVFAKQKIKEKNFNEFMKYSMI